MERLLERDAVLVDLAGMGRRVGRGSGRLVLLRGEAGVGKTAVIGAFLGGLDSSMPVLRGWCDPLAVPRPLGPLVDALAGLDAAAAERLGAAVDAGDTSLLYRRLLTVLRDGGRWVWVIEDAQWADGATLDLVRFLARRITSLPLLLVVSYRDDELDEQHPLTVALGDVATSSALTRLAVVPLSRQAVAVLATGSGINAERLYQLSGGNPFFVTEVLAAGPDVLNRNVMPRSVADVVRGRLARLSLPARETAYATAACGARVSPSLVRSVCPAADKGLDECLGVGMLVTDGEVVGFRHELARRAALDQIPDSKRSVLHARALRALAEPPVDPNTWAAMAFHADQAGDYDAALLHGVAAAERAAALGASREAVDLYALVLRHADAVPAEQKVLWVEQHALSSYLCGLGWAAVSSWREAADSRRALGDARGESENLRWISHELFGLGHVAEGLDAARASLRVLHDVGPCPQLAWALANLAELSAWDFDAAAADYASQAITLGAQLGDDALVIRARGCTAWARVLRTGTGWEELDAVWREAMATEGCVETAGFLGTILCWIAAVHHDVRLAEPYLTETLEHCRAHNLFTFEASAIGFEAMVSLHRGDWDRATASAEDVLTRPGLVTVHRIAPQVTLALIAARRGAKAAVSPLDDAAASSEPDQLRLFSVPAARAEAAWLTGDDTTARIEAQAGLAALPALADPYVIGLLRRWVYLAGGEPQPTIDDLCTPFDLEVGGHWQAASQAWTRRGCPYDAALAQLSGDVAAVQSALETFRSLGARAAARRAQQRLARLRGYTPRTRRPETLADPDGLTPRQREVLELLSTGCGNADIAAALHISPKTVGHHIQAILTKLGVDNRAHAVAHAVQRRTVAAPEGT